MTPRTLNKILKANDFGDDLFEDNDFFDTDFADIKISDVIKAVEYASNKMAWYFSDFDKYYLKADCNRFHFMFVSYMLEWFTIYTDYINVPIGRCYGLWEKEHPHMWAYAVAEGKLIHINWGHIEKNPVYSGKGSIAA